MNLVSNTPSLAIPFVLATAIGYALATVGMKSVAGGTVPLGFAVAVFGFALAFLSEIILMRRFDVSIIYVSIIAAETVMVLVWAQYIGEGLGPRQLFGAALVVGGMVFVTW
ncbi:5-aminolevulinate synthase [Tropicibacter sp. S64]|uniref:5-aminolevulinate synthase n=1 Tax=Tropicibacter sp. S64 TaxID=3415122 RepID=UPI003C7C9070